MGKLVSQAEMNENPDNLTRDKGPFRHSMQNE